MGVGRFMSKLEWTNASVLLGMKPRGCTSYGAIASYLA
jgi:hypothetical protein